MFLNPKWDSAAGLWRLDLRTPWGLGRHVLSGESPPAGAVPAVHAAYELLAKLQAKAAPQLIRPGVEGRVLSEILPGYLKEQRWKSKGGERWKRDVVRLIGVELGSRKLGDFVPPGGVDLLLRYRDGLREGTEAKPPIGPKAMKARLCVLRQILRWCTESPRRWLSYVPVFPSPKRRDNPDEVIARALTKWIDEASFRACRDCLYKGRSGKGGLARELRNRGVTSSDVAAAAVWDLICKRKLYLSFAMYTGMRAHDLDELDDACVSREFDVYWRHGRKTGIEVAAEEIPRPLLADIEFEIRRIGRPWRHGEKICGGPWKYAYRAIAVACRDAGVDRFNRMDLRRSFVYHKALAGVEMNHLINLMGHVDSAMIRQVYLQLQPRLQRDKAGAAWPEMLTHKPGTGDARILRFKAPDMHREE